MKIFGFKCYRQLEISDCGLTCIRMIARYFGRKIPLEVLRGNSDITKQGMSLSDIKQCCASVGIVSIPIRPNIEELYSIPCPSILYWNQNHFVVLYKASKKSGKFYVADPAKGKLCFSQNELIKHWNRNGETGIAVITSPSPEFYTKEYEIKRKANLIKSVVSDFLKYKTNFVSVLLLSLICMLADVAIPMIFKRTIDEGLQLKDIGLVWMFIVSQLFIFLGSLTSSNITNIILVKLGIKVNMEMMSNYLSKLIGKTMIFFDRKSSSDLIQKMNDQDRIKNFLISLPQSVFFTVLNCIVFSVLLFYFSPVVFFIFILLSLIGSLWNAFFLRRRATLDYQYFSEAAENRNIIYELINGIIEIKANNAHKKKIDVWKNSQNTIDQISVRQTILGIWMDSGSTLICRVRDILITGICATFVIQGDFSLGSMMTVGFITGSLSVPFSTIVSMFSQIQDASISHERLDEILSEEEDIKEGIAPISSVIRLENIWFKYSGTSSPYVLKNISFHINPGQTIALVGESGCGKTTLIKLMMGFYLPQKGSLYLGDNSREVCDEDEWLRKCGAVMQSGYIFSASLAENIAVSDTDLKEEAIWKALEVAGLKDFVLSMPMGLYTRIGTTGVELSGGQKQRLLIARAVYKNPDIIFLDEATSSLDANNESIIHRNLHDFFEGKTVVIAAHRLSTVKSADKILFIENGEVVESGTHEQLLALSGRYCRLVSNQLELSV